MTLTEKPPAASGSEAISQSEIEDLLSQFGSGDAPQPDFERPDLKDSPKRLARHLFQPLSFFSSTELRRLRLRHEELIRYVGVQLASYLRLECVLQMSKLETMPFHKFIDGLSDPTHLTLFKVAPLRGVCLLDIPPRLGLCLVDRQLGGPALKVDNSRNLSEIEVRLISRASELILSEWSSYWSSLIDLRHMTIGVEGNGRFVQSCSPETIMLVLGITTWVGGEIMDEMQLAFPHYTLEPLVAKLVAQSQGEPGTGSVQANNVQWNPALEDLTIPMDAEFPPTPFSTRKLAQLKVGDFIPLDPELAGQLTIRLGGLAKFRGELGNSQEHRAVKITQLQQSKTSKSK